MFTDLESGKILLKNFQILLYYWKVINLHERNNIIKLQSLIYNQLSSPRYNNLFKYSWYKSGYLKDKLLHFDNPIHYCFKNCESFYALMCDNEAVIKCAWCTKSLCIQDFCIHFYVYIFFVIIYNFIMYGILNNYRYDLFGSSRTVATDETITNIIAFT